jgi:type IV pilus assembly protein PilX
VRTFPPGSGVLRNKQRGVVLVIALIVLVGMALAGIAMVRAITGGLGISGNLAFKQTATAVADLGVETGVAWLVNKRTTNTADTLVANIGPGYYSNWAAGENPITAIWDDTTSVLVTAAGSEVAGNSVRYKIHRLCSEAGRTVTDPLNSCVVYTSAAEGSARQGFSDGESPLATVSNPYYRITARVVGPRNTVSFVQTIMY